jgi:probable HAF family extracellular repeat protein
MRAFSWTAAGGMADLGTLPGDSWSQAIGLNENGQVIGVSFDDGNNPHGFLYTPGAGMVSLGALPGGRDTWPVDINDAGKVVGYARGSDGSYRGYSWTSTGGLVELDPFADQDWAEGVNNSGTIVGYTDTSNGYTGPLVKYPDGSIARLAPPALEFSQINDSGQVAGLRTTNAPGILDGYLWSPADGNRDLGNLTGSAYYVPAPFADFYCCATRNIYLSNTGQVAGTSYVGTTGWRHAFSWTAADGMVDIGFGSLPIGSQSFAQGVNDNGQVVGRVEVSDFPSYTTAFSWTKAGASSTSDPARRTTAQRSRSTTTG